MGALHRGDDKSRSAVLRFGRPGARWDRTGASTSSWAAGGSTRRRARSVLACAGPISASNVVGTSLTCALPSTQSTTLCSTASASNSFEPLGLFVVPAHDGVGLLVGLRDLLHHRLHLLGSRVQASACARARRRRGRARRAPRPAAGTSPAMSLMSSGFMPCCWQVGAPCAASSSRASISTSDSRQRELRLRAQRPHRLVLEHRLDLALELELAGSTRPRRAGPRRLPDLMPNAVANALSSGGTSAR